jgi:UDPglucose 6-dehydrogenase
LGLAFKPNTDDIRESPATEIGRLLLREGVRVKGYDPVAMHGTAKLLPDMELTADPYDMAEGCDAIVVCTDWNEFKHLDMAKIKEVMHQALIVDGRNLYEPDELRRLGFTYRGVGRGYGLEGG